MSIHGPLHGNCTDVTFEGTLSYCFTLKAKTGSFCREYPAVISATSDSQDSTDDRFRPEGYDISPTNDTNQSDPENGEGGIQIEELHDLSEDETSKTSSLPGLIIVMPERRKAVASKRT